MYTSIRRTMSTKCIPKLALILLIILGTGCGNALPMQIVRLNNTDLEKHGITLEFRQVPDGLWKKPIIRKFSSMLKFISDNSISIHAINAYTVGNFKKTGCEKCIKRVSNFTDPGSIFKDAWFGVYLILDDRNGLGRTFILSDQKGSPSDIMNLSIDSLLQLPAMDQKLIVWSTHARQNGYTIKNLHDDFHFKKQKGFEIKKTVVADKEKREWLSVYGEFDTVSALTDTSLTDMGLLTSIRAYTGLPNDEVYRLVKPWHPVTIKGSIRARYFKCSGTGFWAVVYFNGSSFTTSDGRAVDTWNESELPRLLEGMFQNLRLDCGG